jgi:hypothetical protein
MGSTPDTRLDATFLTLFGLGLLGVLSLIPTLVREFDAVSPELAEQETDLASAAPHHVPRAFMIGVVLRGDFGLPQGAEYGLIATHR